MKTNAITRIIIWSIVLVLLIGLLGVGLYRPGRRLRNETPAATMVPEPLYEAPAMEAPAEEVPTKQLNIEGIVTATGLNVRSAPTSSASIIDSLQEGDTVTIGRSDMADGVEWYWISSPTTGWIQAEYVKATEPVFSDGSGGSIPSVQQHSSEQLLTATVIDTLNIRSAPNEDSRIVGVLQPSETVTIGRQENINGEAWAYITQPSAGWVLGKYLSTEPSHPDVSDQTISVDPRQIREIDIEWAAGNITIEPADVDSIQFSESASDNNKHPMVWKQNNDKLTVRFSENVNFDFGLGITINDVISKDLIILVPMGWECDSLEIDAASATVDIKNLVIHEVDFDGASGTCNFVNCVVDELDLDTASGDIYFTGSLNTLDCDAASASVIAVLDNVPNRIDMDSMSGDLDLTLPSGAGFTVTMDALSSDFVCDFGYSQRNGSYYRGDGKCKITLDALSGDLYLREYKAADASPAAHHHTDECTADPASCPDNAAHHTEPHHN